MATDALRTYLNDHLGGASAALQLLDHLATSARIPGDREFFLGLHAEIGEDRDALRQLISAIGAEPSAVRQAGGWLAAKFGELKLTFDSPVRGTLDRFEALEVLALGILGKRALWSALQTLTPPPPELQGLDLAALERRAREQHDRVEARRLQSARRALSEDA